MKRRPNFSQSSDQVGETEVQSRARLEEAATKLGVSEKALGELTTRVAEETTRKSLLERNIKDASDRRRRITEQMERVDSELAEVSRRNRAICRCGRHSQPRRSCWKSGWRTQKAIWPMLKSAAEIAEANEREMRGPLAELKEKLGSIETEARTLNRILNQGGQDLFPAIVEKIRVEPGFEKALGAALGEDLDVSTDASAPVRWQTVEGDFDPSPLPGGSKPLSSVVSAPSELSRRLSQIGIVDARSGQIAASPIETRPAAGLA